MKYLLAVLVVLVVAVPALAEKKSDHEVGWEMAREAYRDHRYKEAANLFNWLHERSLKQGIKMMKLAEARDDSLRVLEEALKAREDKDHFAIGILLVCIPAAILLGYWLSFRLARRKA